MSVYKTKTKNLSPIKRNSPNLSPIPTYRRYYNTP